MNGTRRWLGRWPLVLALSLAFVALVSGPQVREVAAGVALFLLGMRLLETGFRTFTGGTLERWLKQATDRTWKAIGFGLATTALMQSSTLVSLITISFLSAGMIGLAGGIGIIIGANLGTTSGAWLIAGLGVRVDIAAWAMPLLIPGVALALQKGGFARGIGQGLTGIGLVFLGIAFMKSGFDGWREAFDLGAYAVTGMRGLVIYTLLGLVITVIVQSSHATLVLTITALGAGQVGYENALALAIGANLGTTVTAMIGSVGANIEGRRLAVAHLVFNLVTAAIAIVLMDPIRWLVDVTAGLVGIAPDAFMLKLALFHTLFNALGVVVVTPLVPLLVRGLERHVRARPAEVYRPAHLGEAVLDLPDAAARGAREELAALNRECGRFFASALGVPYDGLVGDQPLGPLLARPSRGWPPDLEEHYATHVKPLYGEIVSFVSRVQTRAFPERIANRLASVRLASARLVEAVKAMKHLHKNLSRHHAGPNPALRAEYGGIRAHLAGLIRALDRVASGRDSPQALEGLRERSRAFEDGLQQRIDELIRSGNIAARDATSLMNDLAYTRHIAKYLIRACRLILELENGAEGSVGALELEEAGHEED